MTSQYNMSAANTPSATAPVETKSDEEAASELPPASRLISPLPSRAKQKGSSLNPAAVQPPARSSAIQSSGARASPSGVSPSLASSAQASSSSLPGPSHAPAPRPFDASARRLFDIPARASARRPFAMPARASALRPFDTFDFSGFSDDVALEFGARHRETSAPPPPPRALSGDSAGGRLADLENRNRQLQRQVNDLEYDKDKLEKKHRALQRKLAKMKRDLRIARRWH